MADSKLDQIYSASGDAEMRAAYDSWAADYDQDLAESGYQTPRRIAEALRAAGIPQDALIMDYGCGTGLSGVALSDAGFTRIDGADLSQAMLDQALATKAYGKLVLVEPDAGVPLDLTGYDVVTAAGVISKGAAPASVFADLLKAMREGAYLVLSINDLSLEDDEYAGLVSAAVTAGQVRIVSQEHGVHLAAYEKNSGSTVYVLERLAR